MISDLEEVSEKELNKKIVDFPRKTSHEKVIVFDLDETLAHSTVNDTEDEKRNSQVQIPIFLGDGTRRFVGVNFRKGA